jgi:hypothetical protein|tara:strand:+ start:1694 stop:2017 length:324 start_codon:yes stop_codon:yes gene_type:complete
MPKVGDKEFPYSKAGIAAAEKYAKKMGLPMPKFDKPTSKAEKQRMVDAGNYEGEMEYKSETVGKNMGGPIKGYMKGGTIKGYMDGGGVKANRGNGIARQGIKPCKMM